MLDLPISALERAFKVQSTEMQLVMLLSDCGFLITFGSRMTEDATNMEEWGPTTKTMAAISDASRNYDDYVRIVGVLRGR